MNKIFTEYVYMEGANGIFKDKAEDMREVMYTELGFSFGDHLSAKRDGEVYVVVADGEIRTIWSTREGAGSYATACAIEQPNVDIEIQLWQMWRPREDGTPVRI